LQAVKIRDTDNTLAVMRYTAFGTYSMNWITSLCLCGINTEGNGDMAIPPVYRHVYNDLPTRFHGIHSFIWQRAVKTTWQTSFLFLTVLTLITPKVKRYIKYQGYTYRYLSAQHYLLHIKRHYHLVTEVAITNKIVENKRY